MKKRKYTVVWVFAVPEKAKMMLDDLSLEKMDFCTYDSASGVLTVSVKTVINELSFRLYLKVNLPLSMRAVLDNLAIEELATCTYDSASGSLTVTVTTTIYNVRAKLT